MRVDGVLRTLYVLFLEGYSAHAGDTQIDEDLCHTAIRLNAMLLASRFATPRGHALHALFLLQAARLSSRGRRGRRPDPPRSAGPCALGPRDDRRGARTSRAAPRPETPCRRFISRPRSRRATRSRRPTPQTDWPQIVALYDQLLALTPSPVIALQRAIAVGRASGARAGLRALEGLVGNDRLEDDPVLAAAIGELEAQRGDVRAARAAYRRALELAGTAPERRFLEERLAAL